MTTAAKTLYETDFVEWTAHTAELLREGRFSEVDLEHIAEEIQDLGGGEQAALRSQLRRMLMHLVKRTIQPERYGASWRASIANAQIEIQDKIAVSPSLRKYASENLQKLYRDAVRLALIETEVSAKSVQVPQECPYTLDALLADEPAVF